MRPGPASRGRRPSQRDGADQCRSNERRATKKTQRRIHPLRVRSARDRPCAPMRCGNSMVGAGVALPAGTNSARFFSPAPFSEVGIHVKIVVTVKLVPDPNAEKRIDPATKRLVRIGVETVLNPYDEYALEAALQLQGTRRRRHDRRRFQHGPGTAERNAAQSARNGRRRSRLPQRCRAWKAATFGRPRTRCRTRCRRSASIC